jgi:hypothetical protein
MIKSKWNSMGKVKDHWLKKEKYMREIFWRNNTKHENEQAQKDT